MSGYRRVCQVGRLALLCCTMAAGRAALQEPPIPSTPSAPIVSQAPTVPPHQGAAAPNARQQQVIIDIPHCERSLGTLSIEDGDDSTGWTHANLAPPSKLLRVIVARSGCFTLVDRGTGLNAATRERAIGVGLQRRSNVGQGQIRAADYVLIAEFVSTDSHISGDNGAVVGGLLDRQPGGLLGGRRAKEPEANTVLSVTNVRTTETIATVEGYASGTNLSIAGGSLAAAGAVGGGYDNTDVGRAATMSFIQAYGTLVAQARAAMAVDDPLVAGADAQFIPWPPPSPSGLGDVTTSFRTTALLGDIADQIRSRLAMHGYERLHHFYIPGGGFGIITEVERIDAHGHPANNRWHVGKEPSRSSFLQYVSDLLLGDEGHFRLFAFLVTDRDPVPANFQATQMDIDRWKSSGRLFLSRQMRLAAARPGTKVWLFVYEFEQSRSKGGKLVVPEEDGLPFRVHASFLGLK